MGDKIMPQMTQMHFFESETRALLPTPNICWSINVLQVCSTHFVFIYIPSWSWGMVSPYPVNCMITVQMGFVESFHIEVSWPVTCGSRGTPKNVCDVAPWCHPCHPFFCSIKSNSHPRSLFRCGVPGPNKIWRPWTCLGHQLRKLNPAGLPRVRKATGSMVHIEARGGWSMVQTWPQLTMIDPSLEVCLRSDKEVYCI